MPVWRGHSCSRIVPIASRVGSLSQMFFTCMRSLRITAILAKKRHEPEPEHIEGRQESGNQSHQPVNPTGLVCPPQNFVLAEKGCKWRNSRDRDGRKGHRPKRPWDLFAQPTHFAHILLAADSMDHRTRGQEQQAFKKRMRHQMKNTC